MSPLFTDVISFYPPPDGQFHFHLTAALRVAAPQVGGGAADYTFAENRSRPDETGTA